MKCTRKISIQTKAVTILISNWIKIGSEKKTPYCSECRIWNLMWVKVNLEGGVRRRTGSEVAEQIKVRLWPLRCFPQFIPPVTKGKVSEAWFLSQWPIICVVDCSERHTGSQENTYLYMNNALIDTNNYMHLWFNICMNQICVSFYHIKCITPKTEEVY